jgi:phosphinothricin acetyltransferase
MPSPVIRDARMSDAEAIARIYAHHVLNGTASFDTVPPSASDWDEKIGAILARHWPFLVAESDGRVVAYAYATQFRDRPAYAQTCENSVYVAPDAVGRGFGTAIMKALIARAVDCGFRQMIAVVGGAEPASVALHRKLGFVEAGRMRDVGRKFGRLLDTVYLQLDLNPAPHSNSTMT